RGSAAMRERIEAELAPAEAKKPVARPELEIDAAMVRLEVVRFAELARCGAYLGGDRRVTPRERTRWRFTFGRLAADARLALCSDDFELGAEAMEKLIDLACELRYFDYFRSEDPVEAARLVVSGALAEWHHLLLDRLLDSEREDVLEALVTHPALGGPELVFFQAKLAHRGGDADGARELVYRALEELPGHHNFLAFAADIDAPLP